MCATLSCNCPLMSKILITLFFPSSSLDLESSQVKGLAVKEVELAVIYQRHVHKIMNNFTRKEKMTE